MNRLSRRHHGARLAAPTKVDLRLCRRLGACVGFLLVLASPVLAQRGGMAGGRPSLERGGNRNAMGARGSNQPLLRSQAGPRSGLQLGLGGRWWDDHRSVKKLNLTSNQQRHMDDIFEANKPTLVNLFDNLQREQGHLASLPAGDLQDETKVFAAIDRVSQARTNLDKEYAHVLIQIRQQLDPQQLQTLDHEIASLQ